MRSPTPPHSTTNSSLNNAVLKEPVTWAKPSEIPWQAKVVNSVNLIGRVKIPVQFETSTDGKNWAGTIISQDDGSESSSSLPSFWYYCSWYSFVYCQLAHVYYYAFSCSTHQLYNRFVFCGIPYTTCHDPDTFRLEHLESMKRFGQYAMFSLHLNLYNTSKIPQFYKVQGSLTSADKFLSLLFLCHLFIVWYRIPVIFEGDLAHIAKFHLKEKDYVHVAGHLSVDVPPLKLSEVQANVQVKWWINLFAFVKLWSTYTIQYITGISFTTVIDSEFLICYCHSC